MKRTGSKKRKNSEELNGCAIPKKAKSITDFFLTSNTKPNTKPNIQDQHDDKENEKHNDMKSGKHVDDVAIVNSNSKIESLKEIPKESLDETLKESLEEIPKEQSTNLLEDEIDFTPEEKEFCMKHGFNKQEWLKSLTAEQKQLLLLEIKYINITWLTFLHKELTKPYFIRLKEFLQSQSAKTVFPPNDQIYSWSHLTPLNKIKCVILGQDPYHNFNQAHGLAFSVLEPTKPPPSLVNIFKALAIDFPNFEKPVSGNLTKWSKNGVLMLNAVLTVEAHKANSHAKKGWEIFTEEIIKTAISYYSNEESSGFVIMAWGGPAQKRIEKFKLMLNRNGDKFCIINSVHPSPLSAHRGFFELKVFKRCNEWLELRGQDKLDWGLVQGNFVS